MAEIADAINAGRQVITSQHNISHAGWTGAGYIIVDMQTGAGAYKISGGENGAVFKYIEDNPFISGIVAVIGTALLAIPFPIAAAVLSVCLAFIFDLATQIALLHDGCPNLAWVHKNFAAGAVVIGLYLGGWSWCGYSWFCNWICFC